MFMNGLIVSFTKHANHIAFTFVWCTNLEKAELLAWKPNIINKVPTRDKRSCLKPDDLFSFFFLESLKAYPTFRHILKCAPPFPALSLSLHFLAQLQWLPPLTYPLTKACPTFMSPTKACPSLSNPLIRLCL